MSLNSKSYQLLSRVLLGIGFICLAFTALTILHQSRRPDFSSVYSLIFSISGVLAFISAGLLDRIAEKKKKK